MLSLWSDPWGMRSYCHRNVFDPETGWGSMHDVMRDLNRIERLTNQLVVGDTQQSLGEVRNDPNRFAVNLDVHHFSPEELNVKTTKDSIVIEGKHEEKSDEHGHISRHFTRRYALPKGVHAEHVTSKLSADGVLTIEAPKKAIEVPGVRKVPIEMGPRPVPVEQAPQAPAPGGETQKK